MAFVLSTGLRAVSARRSASQCMRGRRMIAKAQVGGGSGEYESKSAIPAEPYPGPVAPADFEAPKPKAFQVEGDMLVNTALGTLGTLARVGAGTFIAGYSPSIQDGKLVEKSSSLPTTRPELPLEIYEFEACPFCRKVREAVTMLDLDAYFYPCPKGGMRFRPKAVELGGKAMFPYLIDPNTGYSGYESSDLVKYLYETYGDGRVPIQLNLGGLTTFSSALATAARATKGGKRAKRVVYPEKPLTLWAYEASPFCKIVRERLCEYEVPYLLKTTPRGSPTRQDMIDKLGRFQVPYLEDPNTDLTMFESKFMLHYLDTVYGPNAPNAVEELPEDLSLIKPKLEAASF
mmetsp:Transcript_3020/g.9252  ORF Transcript_3020/g.9252 Transcript_3020/m.9252 type:complete len:346 (-) Transcript_3020:183-1220(-)